jgi:hypothetical protein
MITKTKPRSHRIRSSWLTRSKISLKCLSVRKTSPNLSSHLSSHQSTRTSYKLCSSTVVNFSDLKTSSKCWSKRPNKEVSQYRKYFHQRKKSWMKRQRRWLMLTVGLYSQKSQSLIKRCPNAQASCNSNPKFWQTRRPINSFTSRCCCSVWSVWKMRSRFLIYPS